MKHIISLSGGIGSYAVLKKVFSNNDKEDIIAVFCDTKMEDPDLYRFIEDIEQKFELKILRLVDGRTPWELAYEQKFLYNSRVANCSKILKSRLFTKWLKQNFKPHEAILYFGIDYTESHRCSSIIKNYHPYECQFPLCEKPYYLKSDLLLDLYEDKIVVPMLYCLGFSHNNCGGFCFKAGVGHFKLLLETKHDLYLKHELLEQELIKVIGKDVSILRRKGKHVTLKELRENIEQNKMDQLDLYDIGGCGCFSE